VATVNYGTLTTGSAFQPTMAARVDFVPQILLQIPAGIPPHLALRIDPRLTVTAALRVGATLAVQTGGRVHLRFALSVLATIDSQTAAHVHLQTPIQVTTRTVPGTVPRVTRAA
jgi:hypothetical protein